MAGRRGSGAGGEGLTWARLWLSSSPGSRGSSRVKARRSSRRPRKTTATTRVSGAGCWRMGGRGVQLPPAPQPMMGAAPSRPGRACDRSAQEHGARRHVRLPGPDAHPPSPAKCPQPTHCQSAPEGSACPVTGCRSVRPAPDPGQQETQAVGELRKETASLGGRPSGGRAGHRGPGTSRPPHPRFRAERSGKPRPRREQGAAWRAGERPPPAPPRPAPAARSTDQGMDGLTDGQTDGRTDARAEDRREGRVRRPRPAHPEAGVVPRSEVGVVS